MLSFPTVECHRTTTELSCGDELPKRLPARLLTTPSHLKKRCWSAGNTSVARSSLLSRRGLVEPQNFYWQWQLGNGEWWY